MHHPRRTDLTLKHRARHSEEMISCSELVQHLDDSITAEIRRIDHRWSPVAILAEERLLAEQVSIARDQGAHRFQVVTPDCVGQLDGLDQPGPTPSLVA